MSKNLIWLYREESLRGKFLVDLMLNNQHLKEVVRLWTSFGADLSHIEIEPAADGKKLLKAYGVERLLIHSLPYLLIQPDIYGSILKALRDRPGVLDVSKCIETLSNPEEFSVYEDLSSSLDISPVQGLLLLYSMACRLRTYCSSWQKIKDHLKGLLGKSYDLSLFQSGKVSVWPSTPEINRVYLNALNLLPRDLGLHSLGIKFPEFPMAINSQKTSSQAS